MLNDISEVGWGRHGPLRSCLCGRPVGETWPWSMSPQSKIAGGPCLPQGWSMSPVGVPMSPPHVRETWSFFVTSIASKPYSGGSRNFDRGGHYVQRAPIFGQRALFFGKRAPIFGQRALIFRQKGPFWYFFGKRALFFQQKGPFLVLFRRKRPVFGPLRHFFFRFFPSLVGAPFGAPQPMGRGTCPLCPPSGSAPELASTLYSNSSNIRNFENLT